MPRRGNAPGLKIGRPPRRYWIAKNCRREILDFPDVCVRLPDDASDEEISRLCHEHLARLDAHIAAAKAVVSPGTRTVDDGTMRALCRIFQEHELSDFHNVKHNTQATYLTSLRLIEATVGDRVRRKLTILDVKNWYANWRRPAELGGPERQKRAYDAVAMVRQLFRFGAALRKAECKLLAEELKNVKFEKPGAREQELTYSYAKAFVTKALELESSGVLPPRRGLHMAIGVAAQFDLILRQRDIIGEWCETSKLRRLPEGIAKIEHKKDTWSGFFVWEAVPGFRWRMKTSKSKYRAAADFYLPNYSLLFPLLELVPHDERSGPIVKGEQGLPVRQSSYGKWFRKIATAAGIPSDVWNMDSRAGGVTEAEEAGADLESLSGAATHSDGRTTIRYIRRRSTKIAQVAEARSAFRKTEEGQS